LAFLFNKFAVLQGGGGTDILGWLIFFILLLFLNEIQVYLLIRSITSFLDEVRVYDRLGRWYAMSIILQVRRDLIERVPGTDPETKAKNLTNEEEFKKIVEWSKEIINSFMINPVSLDPRGIIERLDHILDVRRKRFEGIASRILGDGDEVLKKNLESTLEAASAIHMIYKIAEHIFKVGVNTKSYIYLMQLRMLIPFLREIVMSYYDALKAFRFGVPIGDSIGPMVAERFFGKEIYIDEENRVVYSASEFENRYVLALKANGPGSEVGNPGKAIKKLIEELKGDVNAIITVDAALRLESEETGSVDIGFGAAIGDPGPEKYSIEEIATKYKIPLYAVVIKQSYVEAVTPMNIKIAEAVNIAVEKVKRLILEEVKPEGKVIIAGIGNTIGVGNEPIKETSEGEIAES